MAKNTKKFVVSTADAAFFVKDKLAFNATANLNTSLEVSMQEQKVNGGKYNKLLYTFLYNRELKVTLEAADWDLAYIAANVGSQVKEGMEDVYNIKECVDITGGIGTLKDEPVGNVFVVLNDGSIVEVTPEGSTVNVSSYVTEGTIEATYRYNRQTKNVTIDADSTPYVGKLVIDADKHDNDLGKVGSIQIVIPSYQLSGNFNINLTAEGVASSQLDGNALAVAGEKCADGSSVYAYIHEFDDIESAMTVSEIVVTPAIVVLDTSDKNQKELSVKGLKGGLTAPILLDNKKCQFAVDGDGSGVATCQDGVVKAVSAGSTNIIVTYEGHQDVVKVTVS